MSVFFPISVFFKCESKNSHSKIGNKHETDHGFCSGLVKIQNGEEDKLTAFEVNARERLLTENHPQKKQQAYTTDQESLDDDSLGTPHAADVEAESNFSMANIFDDHLQQQ